MGKEAVVRGNMFFSIIPKIAAKCQSHTSKAKQVFQFHQNSSLDYTIKAFLRSYMVILIHLCFSNHCTIFATTFEIAVMVGLSGLKT